MSINVEAQPHVPTLVQRQAAVDRAVSKAYEQCRAGNIPTRLRSQETPDGETRSTWSIGSRVTAGRVYLIDLLYRPDSGEMRTLCECEAQHAGRVCWHRASVRLAAAGHIAHHDPANPITPEEAAAILDHFSPEPAEPADWTAMAAD